MDALRVKSFMFLPLRAAVSASEILVMVMLLLTGVFVPYGQVVQAICFVCVVFVSISSLKCKERIEGSHFGFLVRGCMLQ